MWNAPSPDVRPSPRRRWVGGGRLGGLAEACHPQKVGWLMLIHHPPPQIRLQSIEKRTFRSMPYRGRRFMTFMTVPWQSLSSHRRCAGFESSGSDPVPLGDPGSPTAPGSRRSAVAWPPRPHRWSPGQRSCRSQSPWRLARRVGAALMPAPWHEAGGNANSARKLLRASALTDFSINNGAVFRVCVDRNGVGAQAESPRLRATPRDSHLCPASRP